MKNFTFKHYRKRSGTLVPFSLKKQIPFLTRRIFIIYGNKNFIRGNHAHHKCSQFVVPIYGKMTIHLENKNLKKKIKLNYKNKKGLLLKPKTWCRIKFETNQSILMVFCNREYEFNDYIENYSEFLSMIKKK
jgi:UDP-2-acetamido-3-amino-2,3-dideoxy-glucuronate N-acetyltransferase